MTFHEELEGWKRLLDTAAFIWLRKRHKFSEIQLSMPGSKKGQIIERDLYGIPKDINDLPGAHDLEREMRQHFGNPRY